jgi:hypothetical protein
MSGTIAWMAAQAEDNEVRKSHGVSKEDQSQNTHFSQKTREVGHPGNSADLAGLVAHQFPERDLRGDVGDSLDDPQKQDEEDPEYDDADYETQRLRRIYRGRTIGMLRRYMKYSIETGRLPSLLGREFFRTQVTSYTVVTFEDRVIFVHDMEKCLARLDEFSQQIIARHILQEHDRWATARLLHCNEKTIRRLAPMALDLMTEILLDVGLLQRLDSDSRKSCQGGFRSQFRVSDCEDGENKGKNILD